MPSHENSKRSRVEPVFEWLEEQGGVDWPRRLLEMAHGLAAPIEPGRLEKLDYTKEITVPASEERLGWLSERADELGYSGSLPAVLEGKTHADCLITCERAVIWIEGKRHDWLSPRTKWDPERDQLARNVEAAWIYARKHEKAEYCVLVCHEFDLRADEQALMGGYRSAELSAGWGHIEDEHIRRELGRRIGTLTWTEIVAEWPEMGLDPRLASVPGT
jgi:hypothetical protein